MGKEAVNARRALEGFLVYGVPIAVVVFMVASIYLLAPIQASGTAKPGFQPYIYYTRYVLHDNGTLELYFNVIGADLLGVKWVNATIDGKTIMLGGGLGSNKLVVSIPSNAMYDMCINGRTLGIKVSLLVRAYNITAVFNSYPILVRYPCSISFNITDRGNAIIMDVSNYKWINDLGLNASITINLYRRGIISRLVYSNTTSIVFHGYPITVSVPEHDYGYVIVYYKVSGRMVRSGFYIEPAG